jgi:hypothetical protein
MEVLNALVQLADITMQLSLLRVPSVRYSVSLYAVIFIVPAVQDVLLIHEILDIFAVASGLHTNVHKCQLSPIRCTEEQITLL